MRLIHTFSGLLSIIGAAFLFATAHALIIEPVNIDPPALKTDGAVKGDPNRARSAATQSAAGEQTPRAEDVADTQADDQPEPGDAQADDQGEIDALLDAPVPQGMLTLRQSHDLWDQGAYFIDARHEHEFDAGHIQYASWLTSTLFDTDSVRAYGVVDSIPPDATVVIYCVGGECDASKNVARRLQQLGFTDLRIMGVGYREWVQAGFPTSEGGTP